MLFFNEGGNGDGASRRFHLLLGALLVLFFGGCDRKMTVAGVPLEGPARPEACQTCASTGTKSVASKSE